MQQNRKGWKSMVDYMLAIKRPFSNVHDFLIGIGLYAVPNIIAAVLVMLWTVSTLSASLAALISLLSIATGMLVAGYLLRCAKSAMKMDFFMPEWDMWGNLFVKGLLFSLISLLYALPFIILAVLFIIFFLGTSLSTLTDLQDPAQAIAILGSGTIFLIACILLLFYVLPAALTRFAATERFGEAFALGTILKGAFTRSYALTFLAILVYDIVIISISGGVSSLLTLLPTVPDIVVTIITFIIGAAASFVMGVTTMTAFGEWYGEHGNI